MVSSSAPRRRSLGGSSSAVSSRRTACWRRALSAGLRRRVGPLREVDDLRGGTPASRTDGSSGLAARPEARGRRRSSPRRPGRSLCEHLHEPLTHVLVCPRLESSCPTSADNVLRALSTSEETLRRFVSRLAHARSAALPSPARRAAVLARRRSASSQARHRHDAARRSARRASSPSSTRRAASARRRRP